MAENVKYRGKIATIGTCENLYYTTFQQYIRALHQGVLSYVSGNDLPTNYALPDSGYRFRFPFPDEDHTKLGHREDFDRGVIIKLDREMYCRYSEQPDGLNKFIEIEIKQQKLVTRESDGQLILALVCYDREKKDLRRIEDQAFIEDIARQIVRNHICNEPDKQQRDFYRQLAARMLKGYRFDVEQNLAADQEIRPSSKAHITPDQRSAPSSEPRKLLLNRVVMVHPELTKDPYGKRGQIGTVTGIKGQHSDDMVIQVSFQGKTYGLYQADALLTLSPAAVILQGLTSNYKELTPTDRTTIIQVLNLTKQGKHHNALHLAGKNDTSLFFCTTSFRDWMEMTATLIQHANKRIRQDGRKNGKWP